MQTIPQFRVPDLDNALSSILRINQALDQLTQAGRLVSVVLNGLGLPARSELERGLLVQGSARTDTNSFSASGDDGALGGTGVEPTAASSEGARPPRATVTLQDATESACCRTLFSKIEQEFLKLGTAIKNVAIDVSLNSQALSKIGQTLSEVYDGMATLQVAQIGLAQLFSKLLPKQPESAVDELLTDFADAVASSGNPRAHADWWLRFIRKLLTHPSGAETRHRKASEREDAAREELAKVRSIDEDDYSTATEDKRQVHDELIQKSIRSLIELYERADQRAQDYPSDQSLADSALKILSDLYDAIEHQRRLQRSRRSDQYSPSSFPFHSGSFERGSGSELQPAAVRETNNSEHATSRIPAVRVELVVKSEVPVQTRRIHSHPEVVFDYSCGMGLASGATVI
ncbi:MAG: hypothetical protein L0210_09510 [Rhodospirillales bacterium]|nr:hypothetical protein [Rhodospirillales bacterium]